MNRASNLRLALCVATAAALLLAGCGRKGPLDQPPSAATPQDTATAPADKPPEGSVFRQRADDTKPVAGPGQKRRLPMDVLLN